MTRWCGAFAGFGGLALAAVAYSIWGALPAAVILVAFLYLAPATDSVVGDTPIRMPVDLPRHAVRRYREQHPGATITEAIAALQK